MNFSYNGFSFQYFWTGSPQRSNWCHTIWIFLYRILAILFAMAFLADVKNDRNCLIIALIMKRNLIFFLNPNFFEKYVGAVAQ
jgi:hypothetical protein